MHGPAVAGWEHSIDEALPAGERGRIKALVTLLDKLPRVTRGKRSKKR